MARTISEIENELIAAVQADAVLAPKLTSVSKVAIWRRGIGVFAFCAQTVEKLFDKLVLEVRLIIEKMKPHTLKWYATTALNFQLGFPTIPDSWLFDNAGYTDAQIEASKVVKYVAVTEEERPGFKMFLRMKLAGIQGNDLTPLPAGTVTAIKNYFNKTAKDAGVKMVFESLQPDKIRMEWDVYINPTILSNTGARLDGRAATPVLDAIVAYMKELPFNGLYVPTHHTDRVQGVEGVEIPVIKKVEVQYGNLAFTPVLVEYRPDAGWLRFNDVNTDLIINYIIRG